MQHLTKRALHIAAIWDRLRLDVGIPLSLVLVFVHFPLAQLRGRRSRFFAFASGIVRVVVSIIVVQLAAYGVANFHL